MAPPRASSSVVLLCILFFTATTTYAFNITRLLEQHSDFSTFNDLLTKNNLAKDINARRTITVLVLDNSAIGSITGKPESTVKHILMTHIMLDYFDTDKISGLSKNVTGLTNLYQTSGVANGRQGFLNISKAGGDVYFSSAVKGAPVDSKMVKSVAAQPFNISVIQLSGPITTPGLDQTAPASPTASPKAAPPPQKAAPPPHKAASPPKKGAEAPAPVAEGPIDDEDTDAPESDGPAAASGPAPAPGPADETADKEDPAKLAPPPKGDGAKVAAGGVAGALFMALAALAL